MLLDETETLQGEKKASPNINSLKGYQLVDRIKNIIESECPGVVSCADLLTISARDATILVYINPSWGVITISYVYYIVSYEIMKTC